MEPTDTLITIKLIVAMVIAMGLVSTALILMVTAMAIGAAWRGTRHAAARLRVAREVRNLDYGTCDGLPPRRIRYLVNELWCIDDPAHKD